MLNFGEIKMFNNFFIITFLLLKFFNCYFYLALFLKQL